jgi:hypothetical protein
MNDPRSIRKLVALMLAFSLIAAACGGDDGETATSDTTEPTPSTPETDPPSTDDQEPPATDDPVTVESDDGTARLTFAPSTLPDGVTPEDITVVGLGGADAEISAEVDGEPVPAVASYRLEPSGTTFSPPALLEIDVASDVLPIAPIFVLSSDGGAIDLANPIGVGEVEDDTVTLEVEVAHFSVITALHGPSPLGTVFLSPPEGTEFGVTTHFPVILQASFNRDFLSHAIVTPTGIIRLRVPRERLELIVGRELFVGGMVTFDGRSLTSQLEIDIDADRPQSEAQEDLPFTCVEVGAGDVFVETGITDLPLELVNEADEVVGIEPRNLLAVDLLNVECVLEPPDDPPPVGTYDVSGQFNSPCGTYPVFLIVKVFEDGNASVEQRVSEGGPVFQAAAGLTGALGAAAVLLSTTIFELWFIIFNGGVPGAVFNTNGLQSAYSNPFGTVSAAQLAELEAAGERVEAEGASVVTDSIDELTGAGVEACTGTVENVIAAKTE